METDLEEKYDVIIQGTGLVECLVAGAAARIGKSVLHLDPNLYYGSQWASFSLSGLQEWVAQQQQSSLHVEPIEGSCSTRSEQEQAVHLGAGAAVYSNVTSSWRDGDEAVLSSTSESGENLSSETTENDVKPSSTVESAAKLSRDALLRDSRRFNIDLAPKIIYSRGEMVELLISSNVARYVEFKCITRLLCWSGDRLLSVPCSRAQVFSSKAVSLLQKRLLMKFLQFAAVYSEQPDRWQDAREKAFSEFLNSERITGELQQYVMEGMALCGPHATVEEGLRSLHLFLTSLGRYGASPFLATLYGSGELPQAFCRLCAVFGGTYILERSISSVFIGTLPSTADTDSTPADSKPISFEMKATADGTREKITDSELLAVHSQSTASDSSNSCEPNACKEDTSSSGAVVGVVSDGRHFSCDHLVIEDRFMEAFSATASATSSISRAAIIVDRDLLQAFTVASDSATTDDKVSSADANRSSKKGSGVALVQLQGGSGQPVTVLQFAPDTSTCAARTWLLHLVCTGSDAEQDLAPVVQQLVEHHARCASPADAEMPSSGDHSGAGEASGAVTADTSGAVAADASTAANADSPDVGAASEDTGPCTVPAAPVLGDSEAGATPNACSAEPSSAQESEQPKESPVVYSVYYNQALRSGVGSPCPNLHFCGGPGGALDYDAAILQARSIFSKMYPGEEFMPRAPDPDEIIFDDPAPIEEEHCSEGSSVAPDMSSAEEERSQEEEETAPQSLLENDLEKDNGDQAAGVAEQSGPQMSANDTGVNDS